MKQFTFLFVATVILGSFLFFSCKKDKEGFDVVTSTSTMDGAQQVPAVTTNGTGTLNLSYNKTTKQLTFTASWTGLSSAPTAMNFHGPALAGVNAPVIVAASGFSNAVSGSITTTVAVPNNGHVQESDLLANKWYFSIATVNNPQGEIRGQAKF